jgi:hypothetical protein
MLQKVLMLLYVATNISTSAIYCKKTPVASFAQLAV